MFIRHGHAYHNDAVDKFGEQEYENPKWTDPELTSKGFWQTEDHLLPKIIRPINENIRAIYSSPLTRCIQTANIIQESLIDYPVIQLTDSLIERQGNHPCNWRKHKDDIAELWDKTVDISQLSDELPVAGLLKEETDEEMINRLDSFVQSILFIHQTMDILQDSSVNDHKNTILLMTHHEVMKSAFGTKTDNCGFISCAYQFNSSVGRFIQVAEI